jgi:hypothetical protein
MEIIGQPGALVEAMIPTRRCQLARAMTVVSWSLVIVEFPAMLNKFVKQ